MLEPVDHQGPGADSPGPADQNPDLQLFAAEVRRGIEQRGQALRSLTRCLQSYGPDLSSSLGTISSWQNALSSPPTSENGLNRVLALERCLGIPAGDLAVLIPGEVMPNPARPMSSNAWRRRRANATLAQRQRQFRAIVERLSGPRMTIPVIIQKTYALGYELLPAQTVITASIRAAHDHVDRYWFVHAPPTDLHTTVLPVANCRVGQVIHEKDVMPPDPRVETPEFELTAVELLFDRDGHSRVLGRGEHYQFAYSLGYQPRMGRTPRAEDLFRHFQTQPCERLELTLEFQAARPATVRAATWDSEALIPLAWKALEPSKDGRYHQSIPDPRPAGYGWIWNRQATAVHSAA